MIKDITFLRWLFFLFTIILYSCPGFYVYSFSSSFYKKSIFEIIPITIALSTGLWTFLLIALRFLPKPINSHYSTYIFFSFFGFLLLFKLDLKKMLINFNIDLWNRVFLFAALSVTIVGIISIKDTFVGLGSDSLHHTLISQIIIDNGKAPINYLPYAPLLSFSYHIGFHSFAAAISILSGIPIRLVIPILGQVLIGLTALSIYTFSQSLFNNNKISIISGILSSIFFVFPAYMLNWGRFPQLLGLLFLPLLLTFIIEWKRNEYSKKTSGWVIILLFSLAITHYRVFIMAVILIFIIIVQDLFFHKKIIKKYLLKIFPNWLIVSFLSFLLIFPWLYTSVQSLLLGYKVELNAPSENFFSLSRMGSDVLHYPTNYFAIILLTISLFLFIKNFNKPILFMFMWILVLIPLSTPFFLNEYMDTISVLISLYIPISIIIGWGLNQLFSGKPIICEFFFLFFLIATIFYCNYLIYHSINEKNSYVSKNDMSAFIWIQENTSPDAFFATTTFSFPFNPNYIISIDGGYWLSYLSNRSAITLPMVYPLERISDIEKYEILKEIHVLNYKNQDETYRTFRNFGITHIFLGDRSNNNVIVENLNPDHYSLIYKNGNSFIYKLLPVQSH